MKSFVPRLSAWFLFVTALLLSTLSGLSVNAQTNVALGMPVTASNSNGGFPAVNATDGSTTTYWESASLPATLTVNLGANANVTSVVVELNPSTAWGTRTQTIQVLGATQSAPTTFTSLVPATTYTFNPSTGNTVTIPVTATVSQVQLAYTTNSGAPGGQAAEFEVMGTPAPNPDYTITTLTSTPSAPSETSAITLNATVKNSGTAAAPATTVNFYVGSSSTPAGTANVPALAVGASTTVSASIGTLTTGSYTVSADVNQSQSVIELSYTNDTLSMPLTVTQTPGPELQVLSVTPSNGNPAAGAAITFTVAVENSGTVAVAAGTVTQVVVGTTTLTQTNTPAIAVGATVNVSIPGTWTAVNGKTAITATADETNILAEPIRSESTLSSSITVGIGAVMPYDMYEAESGTPGGGSTILAPNRTIGDPAGEASGRQAVSMPVNGTVTWTTREATNTIVARFSIPNGSTGTLAVYNGSTQVGTINLVSTYEWLYGSDTAPTKTVGPGPRHIYDEANAMLNTTVAAGSTLQIVNTSSVVVDLDFMQLELATAVPNPNPSTYVTVSGSDENAIQTAISTASSSSTAVGVYIPAGTYAMSGKLQLSQKALNIVGAGPWFTQLVAPQNTTNTDIGFTISGAAATGTQLSNFALFGNYNTRQDGQGQPFQLTNATNVTINNVWDEHTVVMVWGNNVLNSTLTNLRIRDTFADGVNLSNNSQGNLVSNCESRATGDDSFALFNAQDVHAGNVTNNTFQNLTSMLTWRAAGVACYGGFSNTFQNIRVADTLVYSGLTISSLNFGISFVGFSGTTAFNNFELVRCGGNFWGDQVFPALWLFAATDTFTGIQVSNVDIEDPTYDGIMFQTDYVGGTAQSTFQNTTLTNITVNAANTPRADGSNVDATATNGQYNISGGTGHAVWANPLPETGQGPAVGAVTFTNLTMTNDTTDIVNTCPNFTITVNSTNTVPLTVTNGTGGGSYASGTVVNIAANTPPTGEVFAGWTGGTAANFANAASASTTYTTTAAAQTITATYTSATTYALTVSSGSGSGSYTAGTAVTITANTPPSGQVFAGWTGGTAANFANAAASTTTYTTAAAAQTITATYSTVTDYALTVSSGSGSGSYAAGTAVAITANTPPTGQVFAGWTGGTAANFANASAASTTYTTAAAAQTITATYSSVVVQIDAGGGAVSPFVADEYFSAGNEFSSTATISLSGVTNPAPAAVYQSVRWNASFNYTIPGLTAGASYAVRLHFVELSFTASGSRVFNVAINGTSVLANFDIFAQVGENHALVEQFNATANSSGQIVIAFTQGSADNPSIAGIELYSTTAPTTYALTVASGSGSGSYAAGTKVAITANAAPSGQVFAGWTGGTAANFASASSASTTYTTTAAAQTITATYAAAPTTYALTVSGGSGSGSYTAGTVVTITANTPPTGEVFTGWTGGTAASFANASSATTTYTTTAAAQTITATYGAVPATPAGLTATAGTVKVTLAWTASSGATSYNVYRSTSSGGEGATAYASGLTSPSYTDTSVTAGTTYYYKVAAVNSTGTSAQSSEVSATPTSAVTVPSAPAGLTATAGAGNVTLAWTATTGATSYNIYRGTSSGGESATAIATGITATSYIDSAVTAGTTYYYEVAAVNSAGTSAKSSEVHATPTSSGTPPNTAVLQIDAGSSSAVSPFVADEDFSAGNEFSSTATISTSGQTNAAPAAVYQTVRWNASFNYTLPGLTPGASYVVRLHFVELSFTASGSRVFNVAINGTSVLSNFDIFAQVGENHALVEQFNATANVSGQIVVAFTQGSADNPSIAGLEVWTPASVTVPATPTGVAATAGVGQVSLSWTASTGAAGYNIYRSLTSGSEGTTAYVSGVTATSYTDTAVTDGTAYYYTVSAENSAGNSAQSSQVTATPTTGVTVPATPTGVTATAGVSKVSLAWTASSGATSYNVYRSTTSGGEGTTAYASGITTASYTDSSATAGTTYYYKVAAVNSAGTSAQSSEVSATPTSGVTVPAAPTGVTATAGVSQVALGWTASSGATSYNVYRSTSSGGEGTTAYVSGLTGTSYTDTGVTAGTTYYYTVAAANSAGTSAQSSQVSAAPTSGGGSGSPNTAVLQINAGGAAVSPFVADEDFSSGGNEFSSTATISTTGVANAAPAAVYQDVRWQAGFTYTLPGLTAGATYVVRLHFVELSFTGAGDREFNVAINGTTVLTNFDIFAHVGENAALVEQFTATANSSGQIVVAFTVGAADNPSIAGIEIWTPAAIAAAPSGLAATAGNGQVTLAWNADSGAVTYNVYRGTSAGGESATAIATGVTSPSYTDSTVTNNTTYYYKVAAVNTGGTSGLSNEASALPKVVPPGTPTSPTATAGFGNISLSWGASQGATSYNIYRSTTSGGEGTTPYATGVTSASYTDSNVTAGTTYYYTIVAVDSAGNSLASTEVSATPLSATGQGASFPYTRYRAADSTVATYGGGATLVTDPNFNEQNLAAQASNQAYVQLSSSGSYVQWTNTLANQGGVTMRFTLPDSSTGFGQNGTVACYVNGTLVQTLNLTSYYAWQYFDAGGDPSDTPESGSTVSAGFAFDEVHWVLATPLNAGDVIKIQSTGGPVVGVDFIETEPVPAAIAQPAGSVSVATYGAVAYANNSAAYAEIASMQAAGGYGSTTTAPGVTDSLAAFNAAVAAAVASPSHTLYIPAGTYYLSSMWVVGSNVAQLTITGAGIWYTNLQFTNPNVSGGGCSLQMSATGTMNFSNIYLNSMLRSRYDENAVYKCFEDNFGANSNFHDLWEEHFECGYWVADYHHNPDQVAYGLTIQNNRIRNNLADGVNFCNGTYNSTVENCNIRNGGDDGLAVWPNNFNGAPMAYNDTFTHNTIEFEWRSSGMALYGGSGHTISYNQIIDLYMSAGFRVTTGFSGYQFQNNTGITLSNNTFICCGTGYDAWGGELGAIDIEASDTSVQNFTFTNIQVIDALHDGYAFGFSGGIGPGMQYTNCVADGTGLDGISASKYTQAHLGAGIETYSAGAATFTSFTYSNCAGGELFNQGGFVVTFH
jgi:fibronectin type 3 domain-containing protein